jgi:hypothetical protein
MMMNAILCMMIMRGQIDDDDVMSYFSGVNVDDYHVMHVAVCMYVCMYTCEP